ncbi:hypothetical protein acsn021_18180 [Anaerocolumna cellulosilytica]|uniref:Uncharacterized protein n=1 Tax=Anaerocolumna cellulosilytica TaxID=433286 RepID=A0A6S6QYV9_9FIRM|nr:Ig-like domain-containing protein [Anaerocolumna cellulosilytica]MBB5194788.1 hypothetical protein [Anaerocolumna cellulosilytica]BCJ94249.1 hypothetical protein acsn021_18180 [Anaerocolumna cellulosilytica]
MLQIFRGQKRRFMAMLLCLAMVLTMLPQRAKADTVEVGEAIEVTNELQSGEGLEDMREEAVSMISSESASVAMLLLADNLEAKEYDTSFEVGGFTIKASGNKKVAVDTNSKTADDGTSFAKRLKLNGTGDKENRSIHFSTVSGAAITIYALSGSSTADRSLDLYNIDGTMVGSVPAYSTTLTAATITVNNTGDYYIASPSSGVNVYGIRVTADGGGEVEERADWNTVAAPVISDITQSEGKILVRFELVTGKDGADKATVVRMDKSGNIIDSVLVGKDSSRTNRTAEFLPDRSGAYCFKVIAERTEETTVKESSVSEEFTFVLPLSAPSIKGANNAGNGSVVIRWDAVAEAEDYVVSYKEEGTTEFIAGPTVQGTEAVVNGLAIGSTYIFSVKAARGKDVSESGEITLKITEKEERAWYFSAFGPGVNTDNNYYSKNEEAGSVTVASENGKGKLQPPSTDGLAYYYTTINPETENFILSGKVTVDSWTFSNGQEGFGIMAADAVGQNGDSSAFWNNSYMLGAMKVEYFWDTNKQDVSDSGSKIVMKQGIGAQEKRGVTAENIADGTIVTNINDLFRSTIATLDTSCGLKGAGTYNIIGNYNNAQPPTGTVDESELKTTFVFTLQRDNTGYRLSYTDEEGKTVSKLFYDLERNVLTQIDRENMYVGFFASRNAKITVTDIALVTTDPATDPPAEEQEITYVTPSYRVISAKTSAVEEYELTFIANADGVLSIKDSNNRDIVTEQPVTAGTYRKHTVTLLKGTNTFKLIFTPNEDYSPSKYEKLSSYDTVSFDHSVIYNNYNRNVLHVSPEGTARGTGAENDPLDVYTAVQYAKPGQIILVKGGTYNLYKTITVERGINGTAEKMIYFIADERSKERPVFDFNASSAGMVIAGDYWYFKGFDVTKSADAAKGLQLSGDNCVIDSVNTYYNGNTGLQISRYLSTDLYEDWPSNNLILNCTSYGNSDRGYEDADGFAAKLTIGDGNVFDGCIAYNNADDGWDLFAKVETGPIGKVVIKNCVAYGNGYLPDGTNAGNGNGFKLGGSSVTGYHTLINSVSYNNKSKGIDSNSCPDIQVYQCTTFNNESYNVAFYTTDAVTTDFFADGILSYRTEDKGINENIKPKGSQDLEKIYGTSNYYWEANKAASTNTVNDRVSEDWFVNMDTSIQVTRNDDGTINMNGLLTLTDKAPLNTGARMSGTPSASIVIPEEPAVTPAPTSAPDDITENRNDTDLKISPVLDNGKELEFTLPKDEKGNTAWKETITYIEGKLKERNVLSSTDSKGDEIVYNITFHMNKDTIIPKEVLEVVQGKPVQLNLILDNGMVWTINGVDVAKEAIKTTDLGVKWNEGNIPEKAGKKFLQAVNEPVSRQISLIHEGDFGFTATLTINLNRLAEGEKEALLRADGKHKVAGMYYYNPKSGTFTLQSSSQIETNGIVKFTFDHASDYILLVGEKLILNEETLHEITVGGVAAGTTGKSKLYAGGTADKTKKLVVKLPASMQEAIDKELVEYKTVYTSSNKSVATVSKSGLITAVGSGNTVVTVKLTLNDITLVFKHQVSVEKARITFVKAVEKLAVNKQAVFEVKLFGYAAKDIVWMTSKRNISVVSKNYGKTKAIVYGISEGTEDVYIKLRSSNDDIALVKAKITVVRTKK